jgi:glycosyltransferase involved in cell wall biosynthesis
VKVLVNASSARLGGGITVLKHLLPALAAEDAGGNEYVVVARAEVRAQLDPGHPRVRFVAAALGEGAVRRALWEQLLLPALARRERAEVVLAPGGVATLAGAPPQILLIQNVAPFDADVCARAPAGQRLRFEALRALGRASARVASKVVLLSRWSLEHVAPQLGLRDGQAACVPLGRDEAFSPSQRDRAEPLLARLGIAARYVLCVSDLYHYKNLPELVIGFARAGLPGEVQLVLAGAEHEPAVACAVRAAARRERIEDRVKLLGAIPYRDLPALYAAAALFAFPSSCENFPNILVEALASGAPTLSSRLGPMPEIAGDAAVYFDPFDPDQIAANLMGLYRNDMLRHRLARLGPARAARYSWPQTARELLPLLQACARDRKPGGESQHS